MENSKHEMPYIPPWARGPLELIKHAEGHLQKGEDIDRRIALVGFDNAIEVCIDVFIRLHPKLRDGYEISKVDAEKALRNYHSKIEFLDNYINEKELSFKVSANEVVWFHTLRNELYHSGNGMVPELHALEGARAACINVFEALYNIDLTSYIGGKNEQITYDMPFVGQNEQMEFLRVFIEFERELRKFYRSQQSVGKKYPLIPVRQVWELFKKNANIDDALDSAVMNATIIRNKVVHGHDGTEEVDPAVYGEITSGISEATAQVRAYLNNIREGKL